MSKEYLYIGPVPADEECAQVGSDNFHERARAESAIFVSQLWREVEKQFGPRDDLPPSFNVVVKRESHDYGDYFECAVLFDDSDEKAADIAFWLDGNSSSKWDDQALKELEIKGLINPKVMEKQDHYY